MEQAEQLLDGRTDFLLHNEDPLLIELYCKIKGELLSPRTIVSYEREAFVYSPGNVRVTLDRGAQDRPSQHGLSEPRKLDGCGGNHGT